MFDVKHQLATKTNYHTSKYCPQISKSNFQIPLPTKCAYGPGRRIDGRKQPILHVYAPFIKIDLSENVLQDKTLCPSEPAI